MSSRATDGGTLTIEVAGIPYPLQFGDWVDDRLWSTSQWTTGQAQTVQALIGGRGDAMPGNSSASLNDRQTNLPRGGGTGLPDGYEMLVFSIQHKIGTNYDATPGIALADLYEVLNRAGFRFLVQNKVKHEGPIETMPPGSGVGDNATATSRVGIPSPRDMAAFVLPIELRPNVAFRGEFFFGTSLALTTVCDVETRLQGLFKRPVV